MPPKTILFTESGTFGGGSFVSLHQLLGRLDRLQFIPLVAFVNRTPFLEKIQELGVETFLLTDHIYSLSVHRHIRKRLEHLEEGCFRRVPAIAGLVHRMCHGKLIRSLVRIIEERNVDLLYMNDQIDRDFFGLEVARRTGVPVISHLRSVNGEPFTPGKAARANQAVHTFIARAIGVRDYWVARGLEPAKVKIIPNGLDIQPVEPVDVHKEFGLEPSRRIIGCVGRIIPEKGHMFLVDGFARLRHTRADVSLLIVGDGPYENKVKDRVTELGVPDVIFAGRRSDALGLMTGMDMMVQPASSDSFGRTVIEAMLAKTPVVATDLGGIREALVHGENGMLVSHGDVAGLAAIFTQLLDDKSLVQKIVKAGMATLRMQGDITKTVQGISAVIDAALSDE